MNKNGYRSPGLNNNIPCHCGNPRNYPISNRKGAFRSECRACLTNKALKRKGHAMNAINFKKKKKQVVKKKTEEVNVIWKINGVDVRSCECGKIIEVGKICIH